MADNTAWTDWFCPFCPCASYNPGTRSIPQWNTGSSQYTAGGRTLYLVLEPGSYEATYYTAGSSTQEIPLLTQTLDVSEGSSLSVVAMPISGAPSTQVFVDDRSATAEGESRVAIINTLSNPVDLIVDGNTAVSALGWGQLSQGVILTAGPHDLSLMLGSAELPAWEDFEVLPIAASRLRTLIVTADGVVPLAVRALAG